MPRQYAVVLDFADAAKTVSGYQNADRLLSNPLFIVRAGGVEAAALYIHRAKERHGKRYGNWHTFNITDPEQPQGRFGFVGNDDYDGLSGDYDLGGYGGFVGVKAAEPQVARENLVLPYSPEDVRKAVAELNALRSVIRPEAVATLEKLLTRLQTN